MRREPMQYLPLLLLIAVCLWDILYSHTPRMPVVVEPEPVEPPAVAWTQPPFVPTPSELPERNFIYHPTRFTLLADA